MHNSSMQTVNAEAKNLVKDAQELFHAAASLTGEQAEDVRKRGMVLLDTALGNAQKGGANVMQAGREMTISAETYVKENPWRTVALATGFGLLLGVVLGRKS